MKKLTFLSVALGLTSLFTGVSRAQNNAGAVVDQVVHRCGYGQRQAPGLSVVVIRDGQIVTQRAYGLAGMVKNVPVTGATNFRIASVSRLKTCVIT